MVTVVPYNHYRVGGPYKGSLTRIFNMNFYAGPGLRVTLIPCSHHYRVRGPPTISAIMSLQGQFRIISFLDLTPFGYCSLYKPQFRVRWDEVALNCLLNPKPQTL